VQTSKCAFYEFLSKHNFNKKLSLSVGGSFVDEQESSFFSMPSKEKSCATHQDELQHKRRHLRAAAAAAAFATSMGERLPLLYDQMSAKSFNEINLTRHGEQEATPTVQSCTSETALSGPLPPRERALPESRDKRRK
jgi:hypothetical protein